MNHRRWTLLLCAAWLAGLMPAHAGAPQLDETCRGRDNQPVPTRYDPNARFFAEARIAPAAEREAAARRGVPLVAIHINPEIYFIGRQTQQWLYLRQCVHLQKQHRILQSGERGLSLDEEEAADCGAAQALTRSAPPGTNTRTLFYSIESDIERALKLDRWRQLLPGPQRRIVLANCPR